MPPTRKSRRTTRAAVADGLPVGPAGRRYLDESRRPLEILLFLLPLVLLYELWLVLELRGGPAVLTNKAHETVYRFLGLFGGLLGLDANPSGLWALSLPGVLLVAILLGWHLASRNSWRVEPRTVGLMAVESLLAAAALVLVARLIASVPGGGLPLGAAAGGEPGGLRSLSLGGKLAISIGAGLYEEMVFRLGLMSLVAWALGGVLGWREGPALAIAIVASAVLFAIYHPLRDATGAVDRRRLAFFLVAGAWFATLYALRGFGIAVGGHAGYDVAVTLLSGASDG